MQISLEWINELINIKIVDLNELINKLTLGGFEVEEILEIEVQNKKTLALDISATANRSDSLSISGLAMEIAALLNQVPKSSKYKIKNLFWLEKIKNNSKPILTNNACLDFISLTVQNLTILNSPKWLKQKLIVSGIVPENSLVDFQNYVLLETGYPFEFYDLDKIYSKLETTEFKLHLRSKNYEENFAAINGETYKLTNSILTLNANNLPISLAGIIPNKKMGYSKTTTSLLIEGSIFNSTKIRQQSRMLGLRTDRSSKYEKSLKNTNLFKSLYRLISLLRLTNPNLICKLHTIAGCSESKLKTISLDYQNIQKVLGPISTSKKNEFNYVSPKIIVDSLQRLQFDIKTTNDETNLRWKVRIPSLRSNDITQEIDLIEEIGRIYGFNNFLTRLPSIHRIGNEDFSYQTRKKITTCLINLGFNELIKYSLVKPSHKAEKEIQLINPLVTEYSNLRTSLLPNLLRAAEENIKKSNVILEGFEYGHIFYRNEKDSFKEKEVLGGIFGGTQIKAAWSKSSQVLNWFEAKGKLDQLFSNININVYWTLKTALFHTDYFHSYRTAEIYLINGTKIGILGQINPILAKNLNLSGNLFLFELNFELIQSTIQNNKVVVYQEYSSYPKIIKDLSFIIHNKICFKEIQNILYLNGSKFLTDINLLDQYFGISIPKDHTSLCLQLTFHSTQGTLQNKKVEIILNNLKMILTNKFSAKIRD